MSAYLDVLDVATRRPAAVVDMGYDAPTAAGARPRTGQPGALLGVVVSGDGSHAFAANGTAPVVTVGDLRRNEVVAYFATGRGPDGIAWSPLGLK